MTAAPDRRRAEAAGRLAESLAVWSLRLRGYRILARRYRTPVGEIDIVARRGRWLVAAEVKSRAGLAQGLEALAPRQQERIARALAHFRVRRRAARHLDVRYDVIVVAPGRWPRHVADAWRPTGWR